MGDLLVPLDEADLVQGPDVGREAAVDTEDLAVNERGDGEHVEHLAAVAPHVTVAVLVLALVVETIDLRNKKCCVLISYLNFGLVYLMTSPGLSASTRDFL